MKEDRAQQLLALRPELTLERTAVNPAEQFQNDTLRPILKFQNDLLLALYQQYLRKRKAKFSTLSEQAKRDYIAHSVQKDRSLRQLLLGVIIGHFSIEEWERYQLLESELSRRIGSLLIQRLRDQLDFFA
ncbi:MAG: glyoxalase [Bacteroidota bacterium]